MFKKIVYHKYNYRKYRKKKIDYTFRLLKFRHVFKRKYNFSLINFFKTRFNFVNFKNFNFFFSPLKYPLQDLIYRSKYRYLEDFPEISSVVSSNVENDYDFCEEEETEDVLAGDILHLKKRFMGDYTRSLFRIGRFRRSYNQITLNLNILKTYFLFTKYIEERDNIDEFEEVASSYFKDAYVAYEDWLWELYEMTDLYYEIEIPSYLHFELEEEEPVPKADPEIMRILKNLVDYHDYINPDFFLQVGKSPYFSNIARFNTLRKFSHMYEQPIEEHYFDELREYTFAFPNGYAIMYFISYHYRALAEYYHNYQYSKFKNIPEFRIHLIWYVTMICLPYTLALLLSTLKRPWIKPGTRTNKFFKGRRRPKTYKFLYNRRLSKFFTRIETLYMRRPYKFFSKMFRLKAIFYISLFFTFVYFFFL